MPVATRDTRLSVRLRPRELRTVKAAARSRGKRLAEWARVVVLQAAQFDLEHVAVQNGRRTDPAPRD